MGGVIRRFAMASLAGKRRYPFDQMFRLRHPLCLPQRRFVPANPWRARQIHDGLEPSHCRNAVAAGIPAPSAVLNRDDRSRR
jgi:hypothetical protein